MGRFGAIAVVAVIAAACGRTTNVSGGSQAGTGGPGSGLAGAGAGTAGAVSKECKSPAECAVPAICQVCPDRSSACAKADCIRGKCQTFFPQCTGGAGGASGVGGASGAGMCRSMADCPQIRSACMDCPDGTSACPSVDCLNGQCISSFPTCTAASCKPSACPSSGSAKGCCTGKGACGLDQGMGCVETAPAGCKSSGECAVPAICKLCPDGGCAPISAACQSGQCVTSYGMCPSGGSQQWYTTCGTPVCRVPPAGGTGGTSSGVPACDPAKGETAGAACKVLDAQCDPGSGCGEKLLCTTSDPTHGGICPISRAEYKTQIEYLGAGERARLAEDLQTIPLVRYRYKDAPDRAHLGFIIEDVEPSPSVDSHHDRVDLYGYTSMAVAAIQEQHKQLDELRRELATLRSELARCPVRKQIAPRK